MSGSRRFSIVAFGAIGLFLYIWPAITAPVVLWSDSRIDLDWARRGVGIFAAMPSQEQLAVGVHPPKPLYLLFLRCATAVAPVGLEARTVVVLQSLLLCVAIRWVSFAGQRQGAAVCALLLLCLRLRDAASAVMSEALTTAMLLAVAGGILAAPQTWIGAGALGAAVGALFWVRPNAGAIALVLVAARYALARRHAGGLRAAAACLLVVVPIGLATGQGPGSPTLRGFAYQLLVGSTDYTWEPAVPAIHARDLESQEREEIQKTRQGWESFWQSLRHGEPDARRQIVWRAFHGLLGTEFYDPGWSPAYMAVANFSRLLTPYLLLASLSLFLTLPFRETDRSLNAVALLLVASLVAQNLVFGSQPRYDLPFLPVLLVLAVSAAASLGQDRKRLGLAAGLFLVFAALAAGSPQVFDREWGRIESAGAVLRQVIPRGSLPRAVPATLHIRIGPAAPPSGAQFEILGAGGRPLYRSREEAAPDRPDVSVPLPEWMLEENRRESVEIRVVSSGDYGPESFVLFPVIPPPWPGRAQREGGNVLSPSTGIRRGSLDWWAHEGSDPPRRP